MDLIAEARRVADRGRVAPRYVDRLLAESGRALDDAMLALIGLAQEFAMPPQSGFHVGAVAHGRSGALYFGANFEFAGCSVNQTIHAEQAAIMTAYGHGEQEVDRLAVTAAPCGYCRQFLYELSSANALQILLDGLNPTPLVDYLPHAFGPGDLGVAAGLMSPQDHQLVFKDAARTRDAGAHAALEAARTSYAPYTGAFAGAAITLTDRTVFKGTYLENAAFNPSLSPLQSAIVAARMARADLDKIDTVRVAQLADAKINHERAAAEVLASIAAPVPLERIDLVAKPAQDKRDFG